MWIYEGSPWPFYSKSFLLLWLSSVNSKDLASRTLAPLETRSQFNCKPLPWFLHPAYLMSSHHGYKICPRETSVTRGSTACRLIPFTAQLQSCCILQSCSCLKWVFNEWTNQREDAKSSFGRHHACFRAIWAKSNALKARKIQSMEYPNQILALLNNQDIFKSHIYPPTHLWFQYPSSKLGSKNTMQSFVGIHGNASLFIWRNSTRIHSAK
jgi:hypothetical protein